jgi:hypothetical protein
VKGLTNMRKLLGAVTLALVAGVTVLPTAASASTPTYGDSRPCVTEREFNHIGGLHQTRSDVRQIVDTRGVVVSDHAFDGWDADAGVQPGQEYGAPIKYRQIRRYRLCAEQVRRYGDRYVWVEYRVRPGAERVEQARWGRP